MSAELPTPFASPVKNDLVESFKAFYRNLNAERLDDIGTIYSDDIVFRDPVHQIIGIHALHAYLDEMCANLIHCEFEYFDQLVGAHSAYIKWCMHFTHEKFGVAPISVRGISHIQFDEKILFHEDAFDLGQMVYEHVPVLGAATRFLKRRLAHRPAH